MYKLMIISSDGPAYRDLFAAVAKDLDVQLYRTDDAGSEAFAREMDILFAWKLPPDRFRAMVEGAPRLRWIQSTGAGVDHIVAARPLPGHIQISRVVDVFPPMMAEYVLGYLLAVTLQMPEVLAWQRARHWGHATPPLLRGRTAVVVGMGNIGSEVGRTLRAAGLHIIGISRRGEPVDGIDEVLPVSRIDAALPRADVLALVAPLTSESEGLIDARRLALLPTHAWLVNIGRGAVVREAALIAALQTGRLGGAILDVFESEPLPHDSPLWTMKNVVVTPHIAGPDDVALNGERFLQNFARFKAGEPLAGAVDLARGY